MDRYFQANAVLSKLSRNYMNQKKDLPIRPSEMGVLNIITQTVGPHTSVMLTEMLGVSKPMIAAHLSVLEKKGYIVKQQAPEDRRVFYILPTDQALKLVDESRIKTEHVLNRLIGTLGENRFDEFIRLAEAANQVLEG